MKSLEHFYLKQNNLLFIAPPGWGKTYKLLEWAKNSAFSFVYLSPLRALSEEVFLSASMKMKGVLFPRTYFEFEKLLTSGTNFKLLISSYEIFKFEMIKKSNVIYVLDEFHLVYHWGDSFREVIGEVYREIVANEVKTLFLTATMTELNLSRMKTEMSANYENSYQINLGNHKLKNLPKNTYYYPLRYKNILLKNLENELEISCEHTILLFCKYRKEVAYFAEKFSKRYTVLFCRGGETRDFSMKLASLKSAPDIIISTTCLSHGVNLPKISRVYFTYQVKDLDFYIQMLGRGGRKGEKFEVHSLDGQGLSLRSLLRLFKISMILKLKRLRTELSW